MAGTHAGTVERAKKIHPIALCHCKQLELNSETSVFKIHSAWHAQHKYKGEIIKELCLKQLSGESLR